MVWYERYGWDSNPFEIKPKPDLISGFEDIREELLEFIKSGDCCILTGPTGSGKTTLLKWLEKYALEEGFPIYINTSGMRQEEIDRINIDKIIREKQINRMAESTKSNSHSRSIEYYIINFN